VDPVAVTYDQIKVSVIENLLNILLRMDEISRIVLRESFKG
jgi:hypothetical protein